MVAHGEKKRRGSDQNKRSVQTLEGQEQEKEEKEEVINLKIFNLSFMTILHSKS